MATRFTRVTIAGEDRQVDVSLPAAGPIAEQLPMVLRLLSVPSTPVPRRWVLSTPELGVLPRDRSLDDSGILDGMVLHLTDAQDSALAPFVDDVEATAADTTAENAPPFTAEHRRSCVAGLLAVVLLAAVVVSALAPSPLSWLGAALTGVVALTVGALIGERGGGYAAVIAVPAAAVLVFAVQPKVNGFSGADLMLILTAASLALVAVGLIRQASAATAAGVTAAVLAVTGWIGLFSGLPAYRTAGMVVLLAVVCSGLAGQLALGGAGLVNLLVADERGERVPRIAVQQSVRRGGAIATGIVWACSIAASVAVLVLMRTQLAGSRSWIPPVFGGITAAVFALRSRMFSRVGQVAPMLAVPVVGAVATSTMVPTWASMINPGGAAGVTFGILALTAVVLAATGFSSLSEVPRARTRRLFEGLEFVAVLALIPALILVFDAISAMRRSLG
jgi:type VII secretion integral membrane protein EccD